MKILKKTKKIFFVMTGSLSLGLGIIGIFLPVLPTTPFLLLSAACYYCGSPALHRWLLNHKYLGRYIRLFRDKKRIPLKTKVFALSMIWITITISVLFFIPIFFVKIIIVLIALTVSLYILFFERLTKQKEPAGK
jgi:uncharacterized protein